jgi:hypothetical protein
MNHREIAVSAIDPNPHRNFERNPIRQEQVEKVVESIGRTGFWDNIVVRPHPENPGRYQLAYGHNRIEAVKIAGIKSIVIPIRDLSDWDMLCAMVDENETQREVTTQIAYENILASVECIEAGLMAIGAKGTEKQFYVAIGNVHWRTLEPEYFNRVRNAYFAGEGLGKDFVKAHCPSARLHGNVVLAVLSSHFGKQREDKKTEEARQQDEEAKQKQEEANQAKTEEERERLAKEAAEKKEQARKLRAEAAKIGAGTIDTAILLSLPSVTHMEKFSAAVKSLGITKEFHRIACTHVCDDKIASDHIKKKLNPWWWEASGKAQQERDRHQKEAAFKSFRRHIRDGDFPTYLGILCSSARKLTADMKIAAPTAPYYENQKQRASACKDLKGLIEAANDLFNGLNGEPISIAESNGHGEIKQLLHS